MVATSLESVVLPKVLLKWPWVRTLSEHYRICEAEAWALVESIRPFEDRGLEAFKQCEFSLLASLIYAPREKPLIRLGCDLMHLFFVFDEYTDVEDVCGCEKIHQRLKDIFELREAPGGPPDVDDGCPSSKLARDFWPRARALVPEYASCIRHFTQYWVAYTAAIVQETDDRLNQRYQFGLDLPDEVYYHPVISSFREKTEAMIVLINDMHSYIMERSRRLEVHNAVEVVMHKRNISLQDAMDWVGKYCDELEDEALCDFANLPSWGADVDSRVSVYINGLGQITRGLDDWDFESRRYFGKEGNTVNETRVASLIPPSCGYLPHRSQDGVSNITFEE